MRRISRDLLLNDEDDGRYFYAVKYINMNHQKKGEKAMKVFLNSISGIDDAIVSMYMSHRTWTRELELHIYEICHMVLNSNGSLKEYEEGMAAEFEEFHNWFEKLLKWGWKHTTMLRFIDFSITVEGLHRAGQDDWDAHAKRFDNRIIRNSTRVKQSDFQYEVSAYYQNKIIPTDVAAQTLGIQLPETMSYDGKNYVKAVNGYILEEDKDNPDVKRGLYMLSIPSNFIFKINLTEWAHVYKLRNGKSAANPEVRQCCEMIADSLEHFHKELSRELFEKIMN